MLHLVVIQNTLQATSLVVYVIQGFFNIYKGLKPIFNARHISVLKKFKAFCLFFFK